MLNGERAIEPCLLGCAFIVLEGVVIAESCAGNSVIPNFKQVICYFSTAVTEYSMLVRRSLKSWKLDIGKHTELTGDVGTPANSSSMDKIPMYEKD